MSWNEKSKKVEEVLNAVGLNIEEDLPAEPYKRYVELCNTSASVEVIMNNLLWDIVILLLKERNRNL